MSNKKKFISLLYHPLFMYFVNPTDRVTVSRNFYTKGRGYRAVRLFKSWCFVHERSRNTKFVSSTRTVKSFFSKRLPRYFPRSLKSFWMFLVCVRQKLEGGGSIQNRTALYCCVCVHISRRFLFTTTITQIEEIFSKLHTIKIQIIFLVISTEILVEFLQKFHENSMNEFSTNEISVSSPARHHKTITSPLRNRKNTKTIKNS